MFAYLLKILLCLAILLIFLPLQEPARRENAPAGVNAQDNKVIFSSQGILNCARIKGCLFLLASLNPAQNEILI